MNTIINYPTRGISFFSEVDRIFDGINNTGFTNRLPLIDVRELDDHYELHAELPGLDSDDISVSADGGLLIIKTKDRENEVDKDSNYMWKERRSQQFSRKFRLPKNIDLDKVEGNFSNGLLTLNLPKTREAKPRMIKIN